MIADALPSTYRITAEMPEIFRAVRVTLTTDGAVENMNFRSSLGMIVVGTLLAIGGGPAAASEPAGTIVVAKPDGDALILWDVTTLVAEIVSEKTPRDEALRDLESQAVGVMSSRVTALKSAQTISVRVIYLRTGDINPAYRAATLAGVEKVVTIKAPVSKVNAQSAVWAKELKDGKVPSDITVSVTGKLPPL